MGLPIMLAKVFNLPLWGIPIITFSIPSSTAVSTKLSIPEIIESQPSIPNLFEVENFDLKNEFNASFLVTFFQVFNFYSSEISFNVNYSI